VLRYVVQHEKANGNKGKQSNKKRCKYRFYICHRGSLPLLNKCPQTEDIRLNSFGFGELLKKR
jgi:hypothetical protein